MAANMSDLPRVLIVDDEKSMLDTYKRVFRKELNMTLVASANEALRELGEAEFDALITDYAMPEVNGAQLLQKVSRRAPELPTIMVTAYADLPDVQMLKNTGVVEIVLLKPWDRDEVMRWVGHCLRLSKLRRSVGTMRGEVRRDSGKYKQVDASDRSRLREPSGELTVRSDKDREPRR